jgi:hypothetical protein
VFMQYVILFHFTPHPTNCSDMATIRGETYFVTGDWCVARAAAVPPDDKCLAVDVRGWRRDAVLCVRPSCVRALGGGQVQERGQGRSERSPRVHGGAPRPRVKGVARKMPGVHLPPDLRGVLV